MSYDANQQPLLSHLNELRSRLLRMLLSVVVLFVPLVIFSNQIYHLVATPLLERLPEGAEMIATDVASPFFAPIKLTLFVALFAAVPLILHQVWAFVAPGLYQHERKIVVPLLISSTGLFYLGIAFAYFVVFPLVFGFFTATAPEGVAIATDISSYLSFVLKLFFAFGIAFEIPVAIVLMIWSGVLEPDSLREKRPYIIVGLFVIGMMLTPPDVFSQTMLAIPMWLLFEVGVWIGDRIQTHRKPEDGEEDEAEDNA